MKPGWAIATGIVLGVGLAWWAAQNETTPANTARARQAQARAEAADPPLYRWRDDAGQLHVGDTPPKGRPYQRLPRQPQAGIEVHGDRD